MYRIFYIKNTNYRENYTEYLYKNTNDRENKCSSKLFQYTNLNINVNIYKHFTCENEFDSCKNYTVFDVCVNPRMINSSCEFVKRDTQFQCLCLP